MSSKFKRGDIVTIHGVYYVVIGRPLTPTVNPGGGKGALVEVTDGDYYRVAKIDDNIEDIHSDEFVKDNDGNEGE